MASVNMPLLPDELMSMIFLMSAHSPDIPVHHQRSNLQLTSRRFSYIVHSTARFWTDYPANIPLSSFRAYLARSRVCGISLAISLRSDGDDMQSAIEKLQLVGGRLENLSVEAGALVNAAVFLSRIAPLPSALRTCTVSMHADADTSLSRVAFPFPQHLFCGATGLRELNICDGLYFPRRFALPASLEILSMKSVLKLNVLLHAISATPKLRQLAFTSNCTTPPASLKAVSLPALETLEASFISGGTAEKLFRSLTFPTSARLSVTIKVTTSGLPHLNNDLHAVTSHIRGTERGRIVSLKASADGRYFHRDAVFVDCYTYPHISRGSSSPSRSGGPEDSETGPLLSLHLAWDHPYPMQREDAFGLLMTALPLEHVEEVALCTTGPRLRGNVREWIASHGVKTVMDYLSHVTTIAVSSPDALDEVLYAATSIRVRRLSRVVVLEKQWSAPGAVHPNTLGRLFDRRRNEGLDEVEIELREGEDVFTGRVLRTCHSSVYKPREDDERPSATDWWAAWGIVE